MERLVPEGQMLYEVKFPKSNFTKTLNVYNIISRFLILSLPKNGVLYNERVLASRWLSAQKE